MALGDVRYTVDYVSENGSTFQLDIYDSQFAGISSELTITSDGAIIHYESSDIQEPIIASKLEVNCIVTDADVESFINDIALSGEDRFAVILRRDGAIFYIGYLLPDLLSYNDETYPYVVNLQATDLLGILKDIPFTDTNGDNYTGNDELIGILIKIIYYKTNLTNIYDGNGYAIIKTMINWYELYHVRTGYYCPLKYTEVDQGVFLTDKDNSVKPLNCLDVIRNICNLFNARIYQTYGIYIIEQINDITNYTMYIRYFNRLSNFVNYTFNARSANMLNLERLSGGVYSFIPALKNVKTNYNYRSPIGYIVLPDQYKYESFVQVGSVGFNTLKIHFYGSITQTFSYTQYYEFQTYWRVCLKIQPTVGNPFYLTNNGLSGGMLEWSQSAIEKYVTILGYPVIYPSGYSGVTFNYGDGFDLLTPDVGNNILGDVYVKIIKWKWTTLLGVQIYYLPTGSEWDYYFDNTSFISLTGEDSINEGSMTYEANNSDIIKASEEIELPDVILGDGPNQSYAGALFSKDNSNTYVTTQWFYDTDTLNGNPINQLRCSEYLISQLTPVKVFEGQFKSLVKNYHLTSQLYITINSVNYVMLNCSIMTASDVTSGQWAAFTIDRDSKSSLTESSARRSILNNYSLANSVTRVSTNLNWLMDRKSISYTASSLASGVSFTGLNTSALDISLENNQALTLYDSFTNYALDIRIDGAAASGATSITIDAVTPDQDVPSGAYLFINQEDIVYWEDVRIVPSAFEFAGNSDPLLVNYQAGGSGTTFKLYEFAKNDEAFFLLQIPHGYKIGWDIHAHIHWTPGLRGNEENENSVAWKLDYTWANINGTFAASSTVDLTDTCDGTDHKHQMTPDVAISGTGKNISSMLLCRIYRDNGDTWATNTSGNLPLLLEIDFHVPMDSLGSRLLAAK